MLWIIGGQLVTLSSDGITMSFKYDNNGIRIKRTVNGLDTEYFYIGDTLVSQKTGDEVINFAYTAGGAPYGFAYNGQSYFYLLSLQGDVIGIYDGNGNVVVEYTYDSWGKLISITGQLANTVGVKNPLRYRGYYYDTEIGLYYLQSRYYDPETCRFINADSLLVAGDYLQGTNFFAYCLNNPVMYSDPTGYESGSYDVGLLVICQTFMSAMIIGTTMLLGDGMAFANLLIENGEDIENIFACSLALLDEFFAMGNAKMGPPDHPDFTPPKKGNRRVKNPNGFGYGWEARDGGVWVWTREMHGGDGWTIQYPNGKHSHAYPGGGTRNHFSENSGVLTGAVIGFGVLATAALLADNSTGVGLADDALIPLLWSAILA